MMTNLFSSFDPKTFIFNLNWVSMSLCLLLIPSMFFKIPSRFQIVSKIINLFVINNMKSILNKNNMMNLILILMLFFFIMINNMMGLLPYIFTATSHLVVTLNISLPIWLTLMFYGWFNLTNNMFSHLIPLGTPMMLSFFMVFIETISNLIRPITLSVRLTANMISGHLLLTLLSNIPENSPFMISIMSPFILILLLLELAVALIQSYVLVTLASLYLNEIN